MSIHRATPAPVMDSYVYEWVMDYNKPELLTTTWHQNAPFNDFVELLRLPGTLAGCVAIATMQIMAYHEKPLSVQDLFYDNGDPCLMDEINPFMVPETDTVTWAGLKEFALQGGPDTISIRPAAASVALHIGQGCNMKYNFNSNESFSWPNSAKRYLISQGYDATRYISYKESKIISEVKADRPVFVGALGDFAHGHAWVIDGYMERHERKIRVGSDGSRSIEKENVRSQQLVHCNWGWGGSCDGYYDSRSFFSPGDGNQIPDNGAGSSSAYYSWCFRTVTVKP